mmetsp:Transcript_57573/g.166618  ORF Transcript_57573/g.166618 Transcript_57573/m.166618 type:complete len:490 (+) Transcript_57573:70-1539(+)
MPCRAVMAGAPGVLLLGALVACGGVGTISVPADGSATSTDFAAAKTARLRTASAEGSPPRPASSAAPTKPAASLVAEPSLGSASATPSLRRTAFGVVLALAGERSLDPRPSAHDAHRAPTSALALAALLCMLGGGLVYLARLWRERGFFAHAASCLQSRGSALAVVSLSSYLVMLVTSDLVTKHEAERGHGSYSASPLLIVALVELGKLLMSLALHAISRLRPGGACQRSWAAMGEVKWLMLPVAALYGCNNLLNFFVLAHVRMDAYAVWRNMSILFNALFWVWALRRTIEPHRWVAVVLCMLGSTFDSVSPDGRLQLDIGVVGVLLSALLSSSACVFNECVIKSQVSSKLSLDQLNIVLYSETFTVVACAGAVRTAVLNGAEGLTHAAGVLIGALLHMDRGLCLIIALQVALGLSVSYVLKHADAVAKTVVGSLREVAVVFLAPWVVVHSRSDALAVGSACLVGVAGMIYSIPSAATVLRPKDGKSAA